MAVDSLLLLRHRPTASLRTARPKLLEDLQRLRAIIREDKLPFRLLFGKDAMRVYHKDDLSL